VKQGAHFSIAPEFDKSKIAAISHSAELRSQTSVKQTVEAAKSDQLRVTGFNKRTIQHQEPQNNTQNTDTELTTSAAPEIEFDEFANFHSIELATANISKHQESSREFEGPLEAEKPVSTMLSPVVVPENIPAANVTFKTINDFRSEEIEAQAPQPQSPSLVDLGLKPLSQLTVNAKPPVGDLPNNTAAAHLDQLPARHVVMGESRDWELVTKEWEAPGVGYNALYFEEPYLERYGYNYGALQPFISAGRFFGRIPALPYMIGTYPLDEMRYPLGLARPGDCPPYQVEKLPLSARGVLFESLTVTGLIFLIP
tara:strand:- start:183279 stop:184214 length:936 start_codon:yes stop_codon:yes gene_type:complete